MVARFHYDDRVYRRLLHDELPAEQLDEITEHIEACEACQTKLESVSEEGIVWSDVRGYLLPAAQTATAAAPSTLGVSGFCLSM